MSTDEVLQLLQDLNRYTESNEWPQALQTIEKLAEIDRDPISKGTWYYRAGWIFDEHLGQRDPALDHFNTALDIYFMDHEAVTDELLPTALKPLRAIERLLAEAANWKGLDRAYRKMMYRTKSPTARFSKLQAELYDRLGVNYLSRLGDKTIAKTCFEEAQRLDPANEVRTGAIDRNEILRTLAATPE
jgi:tetratricopeptide (TPR) repeat protein